MGTVALRLIRSGSRRRRRGVACVVRRTTARRCVGAARASVAGDGRDPAHHLALLGRRHRLHLRPGLPRRRCLAEDHGPFADAQHRLRHRARCATKSCSAAPSRSAAAAIRSPASSATISSSAASSPGTSRDDSVTPSPRALVERVHQLWITPHGVLKAAQRGDAQRARGRGRRERGVVRAAGPLQRDGDDRRRRPGATRRLDRPRPGARRHRGRHDLRRLPRLRRRSASRRGCARRSAAIRCSTSRSRKCRSIRRWRWPCPRRRATSPSASRSRRSPRASGSSPAARTTAS